jgi:hypothetical protein
MPAYLAQPFFLQFIVPLITAFFSVFVKVVSRNDRFRSNRFRKEDLAIGLDLAATAVVLFVAQSADLAHRLVVEQGQDSLLTNDTLVAVPWLVLAFVVGIWGMSTFIRWFGWEDNDNLKVVWGIAIPDILGLVMLAFVVSRIG